MLSNPKEAIYFFCPAALALPANLFDLPLVFYVPLIPLASLCLPFRLAADGRRADRANQSFTASFLFFAHLPPSPASSQSLPEKTEPDGVYDPITAWTRCRLLPHSATNTHTLTQRLSSGRWYGGETHKFTCRLTLVTVRTTAEAEEKKLTIPVPDSGEAI